MIMPSSSIRPCNARARGPAAAIPVLVFLISAFTAGHAEETRPAPATVNAWDRYLARRR